MILENEIEYQYAMKLFDYQNETDILMDMISKKENEFIVRNKYAELKQSIKNERKIVDTVKFKKTKSRFLKQYYIDSILEASAHGFSSKVNACINQNFYNSVEEANYRLTKHISNAGLKKMICDYNSKIK